MIEDNSKAQSLIGEHKKPIEDSTEQFKVASSVIREDKSLLMQFWGKYSEAEADSYIQNHYQSTVLNRISLIPSLGTQDCGHHGIAVFAIESK